MVTGSRPPTVFISAAEASGDEHASHLIRAVHRRAPNVRFVGLAGEKMAEAGCEVLADATARASMVAGPVLRLGYYVRMIRRLRRAIRRIRPDAHVPVDSPALNWHLADAARDSGATCPAGHSHMTSPVSARTATMDSAPASDPRRTLQTSTLSLHTNSSVSAVPSYRRTGSPVAASRALTGERYPSVT